MAGKASEAGAFAESSTGLDRLRSLLSPYTGVIHDVHEVLVDPMDARSIRFGCESASRTFTTGAKGPLQANGSGYDRDAALAAALGEAVERYSGSCLPPESASALATAAELGPKAVRPERFSLFREDQYAEEGFPFEPFTSDTRIRWVKGWSIPDGAEAYLPLQLAYLWGDEADLAAGEVPIAPTSSNGMAVGVTQEDAVLTGLLELIERDAVVLTWTNRLTLPRLDWSSDAELVEHYSHHFGATGLPCEVIDLGAFCAVPTALALIRAGSLGFGIGAASAPTMRQAWDKALRECFDTRAMVERDLLEEPDRSFRSDFSDIEEFEDHTRFYASPEQQVHTAFFAGSKRTRGIRDVPALEGENPAAWIEATADRLKARNVSAYFVDVAPPDVKEAGLHAVHVLSPELQPLDYAYRLRFLGGERLYRAAHELGLRIAPLSWQQLNPLPHPFP
jgi:ribosomal protein S12 methylthiotransferase accessory factor